jgi:hypothetical protein
VRVGQEFEADHLAIKLSEPAESRISCQPPSPVISTNKQSAFSSPSTRHSYKSKQVTTLPDNSAIEWTEATWNPVTGCDKVSPGCALLRRDVRRALAGHPRASLRAGFCAQALARAVGAAIEQHRWALLGTARYLLPDRAQALADRARLMLERGEILLPGEF